MSTDPSPAQFPVPNHPAQSLFPAQQTEQAVINGPDLQPQLTNVPNSAVLAPAPQGDLEPTQPTTPTRGHIQANAHVIADASLTLRDSSGKIDVTLSPEDLGRLTIKIEHSSTGTQVSFSAERPETHDLMRRHVELLERQFQAMGFERASFDFGRNQHAPHQQPSHPPNHGEHGKDPHRSTAETGSDITLDLTLGQSGTGLDLRI